MGFDAATALEPLDWDFTEFDAGKGVVPEPSEKRVQMFNTKLRDIIIRVTKEQVDLEDGDAPPTAKQFLEALERASDDGRAEEISNEIDELYADFCKQQPSVEQLRKLPYRYKLAFFRWLQGELRPEASSVATPPRRLRAV
jgi:hypothetical protein